MGGTCKSPHGRALGADQSDRPRHGVQSKLGIVITTTLAVVAATVVVVTTIVTTVVATIIIIIIITTIAITTLSHVGRLICRNRGAGIGTDWSCAATPCPPCLRKDPLFSHGDSRMCTSGKQLSKPTLASPDRQLDVCRLPNCRERPAPV